MDDLRGKTIVDAEVDGFGIKLTLDDGSVFDYEATDGGYSGWQITKGNSVEGCAPGPERLPFVQQKTARWIRIIDADDGFCSNCKCDMPLFREDWTWKYCATEFCPSCGK